MLVTIDARRTPPMQQIEPEIVNAAAAIAGAASAQILSVKVVTVRRMLGLGIAGAFTGIFAGPSICVLSSITNATLQAGTHFGVGLVGIAICAAIMQFAETANFRGLIARLFGVQAVIAIETPGGKLPPIDPPKMV